MVVHVARPGSDAVFVEAGNIFFSYCMSLYHDIALAEAQLAL
jgi:hypothetical protein